jgi:nucleotide-binding universal stress UspA family protein
MPTLHTILVPIDGSPPSLAALEHAVVLADDYGAAIEVLHVHPSVDPLAPVARDDAQKAMDAAVTHVEACLANRVSRRDVVGDPVREIALAASSADLIVMGTHGRVGRLHSLLGSVAEGVVRNAPCPVMTVRESGPDYQSFAERRHHRPSLADQARERSA